MKIAFFGDSFCAKKYNLDDKTDVYDTYIHKLSIHYNAEIVNLGQSGSGVMDVLLLQLSYCFTRTAPDVCIFVWTSCERLFHRKTRNINYGSAIREVEKNNPDPIWKVAVDYFRHFQDYEASAIQQKALLQYIDTYKIKQIPQNTKIIHMWSFGGNWVTGMTPEKITYNHQWSRGVEIRPPLIFLSLKNSEHIPNNNDTRPNHLEGNYKNTLVFNWIKTAIDNYEDGKILNFNID
jgi:hypothetical protein